VTPWAVTRIATRALGRNKVRSFLTVLGIVIGIAAVIAMVAVGRGAQAKVAKVFEAMGTNLLIVMPGASTSGGVMGQAGSRSSLTWGDLEAIRTELSAVRWAAPSLQARGQVASDVDNWNTQVQGTTPEMFRIRNWAIVSGAAFDDAAAGAKVAVIGQTVASRLYPEGGAVGQTMRINNAPFEVIGVLDKKGQSGMGQDNDDVVFIPAKTFQAKIEGGLGTYLRGPIFVSAVSSSDTERAQVQITALLRDRHKVVGDDDFTVRNLAEFAKAQAESTGTITTLLAAVAAVSLLVGGIGVMNIMLVSVVERTREIGIRMAVGARPEHVLAQFLAEAMLLAITGGLLGLALGWYAAAKMAARFGWSSAFPTEIAVAAVAISGGIGVVFGLYPAIKASQLDPIVALRSE
jgi:putative ABC transport system permease protein